MQGQVLTDQLRDIGNAVAAAMANPDAPIELREQLETIYASLEEALPEEKLQEIEALKMKLLLPEVLKRFTSEEDQDRDPDGS